MNMAGVFSPIRVLVLFISLALPALFILPLLKVELLPHASNTVLQISVSLPQATPASIERRVISPLENALSAIRGLKNIRSASRYEQGSIALEFERKEDMAARRFEVATVLRSIYPKLPNGVSYPQLSNETSGSQLDKTPSLLYSIEGEGNVAQVRQQAEVFFRHTLLHEDKVANILFQGGEEEVIVIEFDPQAIKTYGLTVSDLEQAIEQNFGSIYPGVSLDALDRKLFVRAIPSKVDPTLIQNTILQSRAGFPLRIKQVAQVYQQWEEPERFFRINGKNAVSADIYLSPDCNKAYEAQRIQYILAQAAQNQNELRIRLEQDTTTFVREELHKNWVRASISLLILLLILFVTYRQWRLLVILFFSLIINLALTILASWIWGVEWHAYTLAGLSIAFGLMIDNAIVMLDSYRRKLNRRIFTALLGATLTTAAALLLVFFLPWEQQRDLADFALIILLSLVSSLLSVLFLVPACYDLWVGKPAPPSMGRSRVVQIRSLWLKLDFYRRGINFCKRWQGLFYLGWVLLFGLPVFLLPLESAASSWHLRWLNTHTFQQEIRPHLEYWLGGTLRLFVKNFNAENYYRQPSATALYVHAELPHGHALQHMNTLMQHFERFLSQQTGVATFTSSIFSGQNGDLEIRFTKAAERTALPIRLQTQLQELAQGFSGVQWTIYGKGENFSNNLFMDNRASTGLILRGYDYQELERQAEKLGQLLAQNMRVQNIELDQNLDYFERPLPELHLSLDAAKAAERGTRLNELLGMVQKETAVSRFSIQAEKESKRLVIKAKNSAQFNVHQLLHNPLNPSIGANVKIQELGKLEFRQSSNAIHRENRQYLRLVTYEYIGSYDLARTLQQQLVGQMNREMPLGYSVAGEEGRVFTDAKSQFYLLLILLAVNFFICAILFEDLRQPFFILLTVPISFIGVFLSFGWGKFTFDQGGFAAFVMLGGIVVNATIFIINDLNNAKGRLSNFQSTLIKVLYRRSGTILLTIVSTICGFIPFIYEGPETPFWFALAVGTIGGLLLSVVAVFVVLPVLLWKKNRIV